MRTIADLLNLEGRKALITGGAGHIASACAEALLEQGARICLLDLNLAACEQQASRLGEHVIPFACDLGSAAATQEAGRKILKLMGGLDILIHCAAHGGSSDLPGWAVPLEQQTAAAWNDAFHVNVTSAFVLAQETRTALMESGCGTIILFSSIYGVVSPDMQLYRGTKMGNPVGYGVSKGGLLQLGRYLATALAPKVRVNTISPGGVWRDQPSAFIERYEERVPMRRMATEEDLKGAVVYLASDLSAYVTGHNLIVDGGWTAW